MSRTIDIKYKFQPHDGTPGLAYDDFEKRLINCAAGETDDRGYSLADTFLLVDEGSAGGPALPGGAAGAKAASARRRRLKDSYSLLTMHELDQDHVDHMTQNHFQDGPAAFAYLQASCQQAIDRLRLRSMEQEWNDFDLLQDVGVGPNSISDMAKKLKAHNSRRPVANRKDQTAMTERLLELIFSSSKHFSTEALKEYNAAPAAWVFVIGAGGAAGQRDFAALTQHFQTLWKAAVDAKMPGFHTRPPASKPARPVRTTLEAGLSTYDSGDRGERANRAHEQLLAAHAGGNDFYVPRAGSPSGTLALLADAGDDLAGRHGTLTTTDWGLLSSEEICQSVEEGEIAGECALISLADADDAASVELICDCCRGLGHIRRVCPSNRNKSRSLSYAVACLQAKLSKVGGKSNFTRRPPGRGQRAPFRPQPRRFAPVRRPGGKGWQPQRDRASAAEEGDDYDDDFANNLQDSSAATGSLGTTEKLDRATEKVSFKPPPGLSDDALFQNEKLNVITEAKQPNATSGESTTSTLRPTMLSSGFLLLYSVAAVIAAVAAATLDGIDRMRAIGSVLVLTVLLAIMPLARSHPVERIPNGHESGYIAGAGPGCFMTVDSGATSTAVPLRLKHILDTVTDPSPNQKIWIADDKALKICQIGTGNISVPGYQIRREPGVAPKDWKQVPCIAKLPSSRILVVDGLGENTFLLSVKGMKQDGVKTFLNNDNSIGREDCLLLPDGITVVPFTKSHAYQIPFANQECAAAATDVTSRRSAKAPRLFHRALGHAGIKRAKSSNIIMDGVLISDLEHDPSTCPGCRLGNTGRSLVPHQRWKTTGHAASRTGFTHFGQQMDTDICTGFKPSFPHGFTSMMNFNDRHTIEKWLYFLRSGESAEICSSLAHLHGTIEHRLKDGKIGRWLTDNGRAFLSDQVEELSAELVSRRGYSVPNDSDTLPVPERNWGVLERMMRSMHADAADPSNPKDPGAPECLWSWSANQSNRLLHYLSTAAHDPPMSPHQFVTGDKGPVDLSWARTMFCDVTITLPKRNVDGKVTMQSADACHLGYDSRRGCHFCYCESLQRLSSFTVTEWREDSFLLCKRISSDSPVEYFEAHDLPFSDVTSSLIPHRHTARARRERGAQLRSSSYRTLILWHRDRPDSLPIYLRQMGHTVTTVDIADSPSQNLLLQATQYKVLDSVPQYDFVFMCPPCISGSIAYCPPLRTVPNHARGVPGLTGKQQAIVDEGNDHWDFAAEVIHCCNQSSVNWALESCALRRRKNAANWPRFHSNAMIWDYPPVERCLEPHTSARVRTTAQCRFNAPWQKYTDLGTSPGANTSFDRVFLDTDCICKDPHSTQLQGYDVSGVARTLLSQEYKPGFAKALATAIDDTCRASRDGDEMDWEDTYLRRFDRVELCQEIALAALAPESSTAAVTHGLTHAEISELHANAHRELHNVSPDMEIILEDSEGVYRLLEECGYSIRISETGSELAAIKTVEQAMNSKHWLLFKAAMEEEIQGKRENNAWKDVPRPPGIFVHKSRWVFAVKLHDDNSVKLVKARFVGCGYTQREGKDYTSVFAATLPSVSFRFLITWITDEDLETDHIDAVKAFTQARIDRVTYVESPNGFTVDGLSPALSTYCLLLYMALEGIKQGAYLWFGLNKGAWLKLGFKSWLNETNLYKHPSLQIRIGVFADDTISGFHVSVKKEYLAIKAEYAKIIKIGTHDTISPVIKFTGVQIERDRQRRLTTIHQRRYIEQMHASLKAIGVELKPYDTPHGTTKEERSRFDKLMEDKTSPPIDKIKFLELMGKLVWPSSMTRPDCSMEVSSLCSCMADPRQSHYDWGLVVAGYLWSTKEIGITYGGNIRIPYGLDKMPPGLVESHGLHTPHDSSWGTRPYPLGGYAIMYLNGVVDWSSKQVKIVPVSSCEAETAVASTAAKATCFARELLRFHGRPVVASTPMLGDNEATHTLITQEGATARTRYYERATLLVKRAVLMLVLNPLLVKTTFMLADIFTKAADKPTFVRLRNRMMNCHAHLDDPLRQAAYTLHDEGLRMLARLRRQM